MEPLYIWSMFVGFIYDMIGWNKLNWQDFTRSEWLKERWSLREDLYLSYFDSPEFRKHFCWFTGHKVKFEYYPLGWDIQESWCERCWLGDPIKYPEWGLPGFFNRIYVWICDRNWARWEKFDLWLCNRYGRRLPFWWEY